VAATAIERRVRHRSHRDRGGVIVRVNGEEGHEAVDGAIADDKRETEN
jgi:hypothetical protein